MVRLNGEACNSYDNITITAMLEKENYDAQKVVVEINEEIIPRNSFDTHIINPDDTVEVLSFVGGG